jgi:hypothetical protein
MLKNSLFGRLLKRAQTPILRMGTRRPAKGGVPSEAGSRRTSGTPQRVPERAGHPPMVGHRRWSFFSSLLAPHHLSLHFPLATVATRAPSVLRSCSLQPHLSRVCLGTPVPSGLGVSALSSSTIIFGVSFPLGPLSSPNGPLPLTPWIAFDRVPPEPPASTLVPREGSATLFPAV